MNLIIRDHKNALLVHYYFLFGAWNEGMRKLMRIGE
jgi:hypothetical protein